MDHPSTQNPIDPPTSATFHPHPLINHPKVGDFQQITFWAIAEWNRVFYNSLIVGLGLFVFAWDAYFWQTILSLPLSILLPVFAAYLMIDSNTLSSLDSTWFWKSVKRICDATTIPVWLYTQNSGTDLTSDTNFPSLLLIQWALLPLNTLLVGSWTLILWPLTAFFVFYTQMYYEQIVTNSLM